MPPPLCTPRARIPRRCTGYGATRGCRPPTRVEHSGGEPGSQTLRGLQPSQDLERFKPWLVEPAAVADTARASSRGARSHMPRADHQAREDRETGEEHRMRENTAFHFAVWPHAGACPSPTSPSPVALAEALTGLPSRPLPPRGPWQVRATAPVKGRARFAALATSALSAFSSSAVAGRVSAAVFACPPNGGSCPRSGGSRVDRSSRRGWL